MNSRIPTHLRIASALLLSLSTSLTPLAQPTDPTDPADPRSLPPLPPHTIGFPSRAPDLDALPGFRQPPPGYGEVAFYWWLGDPLTRERLTWQLDQLATHRVSALQINYAHTDRGGRSYGLTFPSDPPLFSEPWWDLFRWFLAECQKRGIAASLSDYTLCAPGQGWWTDEIIREHPGVRGSLLEATTRDAHEGQVVRWTLPAPPLDLRAWSTTTSTNNPNSNPTSTSTSPVDLRPFLVEGELQWTPPAGSWRIVAVHPRPVPLSIDPMHPDSGPLYLAKFFQRFEDRNPGQAGRGLNFFFSDELDLGIGGKLWNDRFASEFQRRKGYDLRPELAALFTDIGPRTPKIRLDYTDVVVTLSEEGFFRPIFDWHRSRGMLFGCDHGGRGRDVVEFGDYFRTQRWMTGPGNDSPFLSADVVKNKVASSIAHLYERPRTWLEGFHSSGWGTTSAQVADATFRNFVSGHNLLTLHGLYYSTHGGFWEWAPPCNHFRLPYWNHLRDFLQCSERLSYLLSQGTHRCDVAILYPVAPMQAGLGGDDAVRSAFEIAPLLFDHGLDFDYLDFQSLARAEIRNRSLEVAGESFRVLILPAMRALRHSTLQKALAFHRAGGLVLAVGALPEASDRIGRNDPDLDAAIREIFGRSAHEPQPSPNPKPNAIQPATRWFPRPDGLIAAIDSAIPPDFTALDASGARRPARVHHRRVGSREVFMVHGLPRGSECRFRAHGQAELWDPWTGQTRPLFPTSVSPHATHLRTVLQPQEPQLIVFNPAPNPVPTVTQTDFDELVSVSREHGRFRVEALSSRDGPHQLSLHWANRTLSLHAHLPPPPPPLPLDGPWRFQLQPTLDNRFGDFRIPPSPEFIGPEARRFRWADASRAGDHPESTSFDDSHWPEATASFGLQFWKLGPLPKESSTPELETLLAHLTSVDPAHPPTTIASTSTSTSTSASGQPASWQPYEFSWRWGPEGDPGHQGWHGLKKVVSDDFLQLGSRHWADRGFVYRREPQGSTYFLWSTVLAPQPTLARLRVGGLAPTALWLNGNRLAPATELVPLNQGPNPVLVRYDDVGRGHVIFERADLPPATTQPDLAMSWFENPCVLPFEPLPQSQSQPRATWFRFLAPPGLRELHFTAHGQPQLWVNGQSCPVHSEPPARNGSRRFSAQLPNTALDPATVALRLDHPPGFNGATALPEPIQLTCQTGRLPAGDWSKVGVLSAYSGAARYQQTFSLGPDRLHGRTTLELGDVRASAEVWLNGKPAGIRVAPPFDFDVTPLLRPGENSLEILVCNTLANHYLTLPTRYRGDLTSGLLGPVRLTTRTTAILSTPIPP